jgi:hypothetical protein
VAAEIPCALLIPTLLLTLSVQSHHPVIKQSTHGLLALMQEPALIKICLIVGQGSWSSGLDFGGDGAEHRQNISGRDDGDRNSEENSMDGGEETRAESPRPTSRQGGRLMGPKAARVLSRRQ